MQGDLHRIIATESDEIPIKRVYPDDHLMASDEHHMNII